MNNSTTTQEVTIRYFAWVREKVGRGQERVQLPAAVVTIADMMAWQQSRGEQYAAAFARPDVIRVALDRVHVKSDTAIGAAREIGFFPPMTGG